MDMLQHQCTIAKMYIEYAQFFLSTELLIYSDGGAAELAVRVRMGFGVEAIKPGSHV